MSADAKAKSEAALKDQQAKAKRITDAKAAADKKVADVKKANAAKDVNVSIVSTPIKLRVVATPIAVKLNTDKAQVKPTEKGPGDRGTGTEIWIHGTRGTDPSPFPRGWPGSRRPR